MSPRSLLPFSINLLVVCLLLAFTLNGDYTSPSKVKRSSLSGHQLSTETLPVLTVPTSSSRNIGLPFGRKHQELNFSNALLDTRLTKGAPPREPRAWPDLVCAGGALLDKIQAAFLGTTPPGRESSTSDLENGWEKSTDTTGESLMILGRYWSAVFDKIYPASRGKALDVKPVNLFQTGKYKTEDGTEIDNPTEAYSYASYFPTFNWIIATNSLSPCPSNVIQKRNDGISKEDRNKQLPPLNKLSDLLWLSWNTVSQNPKQLRYIGRSEIVNPQTRAIMDYLFLRGSESKSLTADTRWPGLEYKADSDELKALLATPNGLATAYILIDHSCELKRRDELTNRQLQVNIYAIDRKYFMLWDIEAQSPRG
ncbi:hypothetical protein Q9189_002841 [Teloschistes chrysophthalmus]